MKESPTSKAVLEFAEIMEYKLSLKRHKGDREGWLSCPNSFLIVELDREIKELFEALVNGKPQEIMYECADVANFAMMIADKANER